MTLMASQDSGKNDLFYTTNGDLRGYIKPHPLRELWFHTGTACNLKCPFCFEGAGPNDSRIQMPSLEEIKPFIDETVGLDVKRFSFTGGEPFVNPDFVNILGYALLFKPCHVLTNATKPLFAKLNEISQLKKLPHALSFRVSLDFPNPEDHDKNRGKGNFYLSLEMLGQLYNLGFRVEIARHAQENENSAKVNDQYLPFFKSVNLPISTPIIAFSDLFKPNSSPNVPQITENCMTSYKTKEEREGFMCSYSKMVVKKADKMRVYACTLVDDDDTYDMGSTLNESMSNKIMLKHHRCYVCFSSGTSCTGAGL